MRDTFANIAISVATNTALFTSLDLGQWIADTLSLWTLAREPGRRDDRDGPGPDAYGGEPQVHRQPGGLARGDSFRPGLRPASCGSAGTLPAPAAG